MLTVVSTEEMQWCDKAAIRTYGIPGLLLMENAGRGSAECLEERFGPTREKTILILCGKGNNGGDGFVVARHLLNKGARVIVLLLASPRDIKGDAKTNLLILQRLQKSHPEQLWIKPFSQRVLRRLPPIHCAVDAIFGTGFSGKVKGIAGKGIAWLNDRRFPVIALDIPSGVHGTTGVVENMAVSATLTTTFGLIKTGLLCNEGHDRAGDVVLIDIGLPPVVVHAHALRKKMVVAEDVQRLLPRRSSTLHKYSAGKVLLLAGSRGYTGAPALAASAALRSGAGAVLLGTPESVYPILARKLTEQIVLPLPSTTDGTLSLSALDKILGKIAWADVVALGPGLSLNAETQTLLKEIVSRTGGKLVVDADALSTLVSLGWAKIRKLKAAIIVTPHAGEASRLLGISPKQIERERVEVARRGAREGGVTFVLKGAPTVTGSPDGMTYINSTGNPGMATVGTGDVLCGLIAGMWAQGMDQHSAAFTGVYLHGLAGDLAATKLGVRSLVARDILDFLPAAILMTEQGAGA
ncbi:MAG: NAD(P)H-hydrate dehydratase [Bacteroidota bacterium]